MISSIILTFDFLSFFITTMDVLTHILDNSNNDILLRVIHSYQPLDYYIPLIDHTFSQKWIFIGNKTYRNDRKHSFNDKPAFICSDGTQEWYKNDKLHRDNDKPAVIYPDGTQHWYKNGKCHRDNDKPAVIRSDGTQYWYKNDKLHRDNDKPALIRSNGTQEWYKYGKLLSRVIKAS